MRHMVMRWFGATLVVALGCEVPAGQPETTASSMVEPPEDDAPSSEGGETGPAQPDPEEEELNLYCSPWAQSCPDGQKCALYSQAGDGELDSARCVTAPAAPRQVDESCIVQGGYGSGIDDCAPGLMCWDVGPNNQGVCVPICDGCSPDPQCPEGRLCAGGVGNFHYMCLPQCDPLLQDCIEGASCVLSDEGFVCAPDRSGTEGQIYDPCLHANACEPGLVCAPPGSAPGCPDSEADGCCLPFCTVGGTTCPDPLECVMLFDPQQFPQYAEVGFCAAP